MIKKVFYSNTFYFHGVLTTNCCYLNVLLYFTSYVCLLCFYFSEGEAPKEAPAVRSLHSPTISDPLHGIEHNPNPFSDDYCDTCSSCPDTPPTTPPTCVNFDDNLPPPPPPAGLFKVKPDPSEEPIPDAVISLAVSPCAYSNHSLHNSGVSELAGPMSDREQEFCFGRADNKPMAAFLDEGVKLEIESVRSLKVEEDGVFGGKPMHSNLLEKPFRL